MFHQLTQTNFENKIIKYKKHLNKNINCDIMQNYVLLAMELEIVKLIQCLIGVYNELQDPQVLPKLKLVLVECFVYHPKNCWSLITRSNQIPGAHEYPHQIVQHFVALGNNFLHVLLYSLIALFIITLQHLYSKIITQFQVTHEAFQYPLKCNFTHTNGIVKLPSAQHVLEMQPYSQPKYLLLFLDGQYLGVC